MQIKFIFTKKSENLFNKLDNIYKERIFDKLKYIKKQDNIFDYIKNLENMLPATHRIRVWKLRLICKKENNNFIIINLWNRGDIYK